MAHVFTNLQSSDIFKELRNDLDTMSPGEGENFPHYLYGTLEGMRVKAERACHSEDVDYLTQALKESRESCEDIRNIDIKDDPYEYAGFDPIQSTLAEMEKTNPSISRFYDGLSLFKAWHDPRTNQPVFKPDGYFNIPTPLELPGESVG